MQDQDPITTRPDVPRALRPQDVPPGGRPFGWAADLPREMRPAVPKERTPPRLPGLHWSEVEQQPPSVPVLVSIEHKGITPVFGTTVPPAGVSGALRRAAFRHSESDLRHWLLLLLADRVQVLEGVLADLASGRVPNVPAEMGWHAEWRYNRRGALRKLMLAALLLTLLYVRKRRR